MLRRFLTVDSGEAAMNDLQTQLCNVPAHVLMEAERLFFSQLDFSKLFTVGDSDQGNLLNYTSSPPPPIQWIHIGRSAHLRREFLKCPVFVSHQRERLMDNAADLRVISQAVTSVSQELAVIMDQVSLFSVQMLACRLDWFLFFFLGGTACWYFSQTSPWMDCFSFSQIIKPLSSILPPPSSPLLFAPISFPNLFQFSSLSSFKEMSEALHLLSPENRSAAPRESFRAFSKIMCGHPEVGGERIPSLNWYEDNDIKSFLGQNGTEDTDLEHDNNTSKRLWTFLLVCSLLFLLLLF